MSSPAISSILSQIRAFEGQARAAAPGGSILPPGGLGGPAGVGAPGGVTGATGPAAAPGASFGDAMTRALRSVNATQQEAGALQRAFETGDPRADLARVMVASQASQVAFRATVEVRNRLVQAYQDVMNMPL